MKKISNTIIVIFTAALFAFTISSCTTTNKTMREPNSLVELKKTDFTFSEQVSATASSRKILMIDWTRLFLKQTGTIDGHAGSISFANIPVIGNMIADKTANYALYNLMINNTGYDVVFYPQYETTIERPILGIGFLVKKINVKVTAKLGKL